MRLLALLVLFCCMAAQANELAIVEFSGEYNAPVGSGTAVQFDLPTNQKAKVEVSVDAYGEGYILTTLQGEWIWEDPAAWVKDLKQAQWEDVDVVLQGSSQEAAIGYLQGQHEDKNVTISRLEASCDGSAELIESCLNGEGRIRLGQLNYASASRHDQTQDILRALARALDPSSRGNDTTVKNLALDIKKNKFNGQVTANVGISATVKFEGLVSYDV